MKDINDVDESAKDRSFWGQEYIGRYNRLPLLARIAIALSVIAIALILIWPHGTGYYPEGNWLFGPLWTIYSGTEEYRHWGIYIGFAYLSAMMAVFVRPSILTGTITLLAIATWIFWGMYQAAMAVA